MDARRPELASEEKQLELLLAQALGTPYELFTVVHQTRKFELPILSVPGRPERELSSLATLGLWRTHITAPRLKPQQRLELVGVFETIREGCREALAAAAFKVMRTQAAILPGTVYLNFLHDWYPKASVPHLYFVDAQRWSFPQLKPITLADCKIHFLEVLPITEAEAEYVDSHSGLALEAKLLGASANLWDLRRPSVI